VLFFKVVACGFIWIVTPKIPLDEISNSNSSIVVPADDKYSVFRFIARVSGVACAYEWNAENFLKTYIMEILILIGI